MSVVAAVLVVAILIVSVVVHENAHGWTALALGDRTAKQRGRLTLNPVKHLDLVGSLILPLFMALAGAPPFGYAKPVPVEPRNLKGSDRTGFALVALAGPVSNLALAFLLSVAIRIMGFNPERPATMVQYLVAQGAFLNVVLAAFNLIPLPPLDGSRLLRLFLNPQQRRTLDRVEPYGFVLLFLIFVLLQQPLFRLIEIIRMPLEKLVGLA